MTRGSRRSFPALAPARAKATKVEASTKEISKAHPRSRPPFEKERQLQTAILKAINGAPLGALAIENIVVKKTRATHTEVTGLGTGSPDLLVLLAPAGKVIFLEVKTEDGTLSDAQIEWHARVRRHGAIVHVVRSVEEAVAVVSKEREAAIARTKAAASGMVADFVVTGVGKLIDVASKKYGAGKDGAKDGGAGPKRLTREDLK